MLNFGKVSNSRTLNYKTLIFILKCVGLYSIYLSRTIRHFIWGSSYSGRCDTDIRILGTITKFPQTFFFTTKQISVKCNWNLIQNLFKVTMTSFSFAAQGFLKQFHGESQCLLRRFMASVKSNCWEVFLVWWH